MSDDIKADKLTANQFELCILAAAPKHFKCVKEGAVLRIDYDGIWCTKDEPKPRECIYDDCSSTEFLDEDHLICKDCGAQ